MPNTEKAPQLGTTFSLKQCEHMGLDETQSKAAFSQILGLGFDVVRLTGQWDRLEPEKGKMDFRSLDWLIEAASDRNVKVALTVGLKAPRYPEFYIPSWVQDSLPMDPRVRRRPVDTSSDLTDAALSFVGRTTEYAAGSESVTTIQVENEPLVPITFVGGWYISEGFLRKEMTVVKEVKRKDQRTLLTLTALPVPIPFGGFSDEKQMEVSMELADDVGLNVYNKVPIGQFVKIPWVRSTYIRPLPVYFKHKLIDWNRRLEEAGKGKWIVESQAEPWEVGKIVNIEDAESPSSNPTRAKNLADELLKTGYSPVLFWGAEHWFWHKKNGNRTWWDAMGSYIEDIKANQ